MHMDLQVDSVHAGHRGSAPLRFDMAIRWRSLAADSPLSRTHDDPLLGDVHCSNTCLAASIHGHCGMPKVPGLTKPRFASAGMQTLGHPHGTTAFLWHAFHATRRVKRRATAADSDASRIRWRRSATASKVGFVLLRIPGDSPCGAHEPATRQCFLLWRTTTCCKAAVTTGNSDPALMMKAAAVPWLVSVDRNRPSAGTHSPGQRCRVVVLCRRAAGLSGQLQPVDRDTQTAARWLPCAR
jgi:hypothetical protein